MGALLDARIDEQERRRRRGGTVDDVRCSEQQKQYRDQLQAVGLTPRTSIIGHPQKIWAGA